MNIIIGTMRTGKWGASFNTDEYYRYIDQCVNLGCTTFDHADIYGDYTTEQEFGNVLNQHPSLRSKMNIITKCGIRRVCDNRPNHYIKSYDSSHRHIIESVDNSLKNLCTDYIDTLLIHRPDYLMNPMEMAEAFHILKEAGKVNNFGVSNFSTEQFDFLNEFSPLNTHQVELNILNLYAFEQGIVNQALQKRIELQAWSPFGGGELFTNSDNEKIKRIQKVAQKIAENHICTVDQVYLAFLFKHPVKVKVVLGTTKIERIKKAIEAQSIHLSRMEWYELLQASLGITIA